MRKKRFANSLAFGNILFIAFIKND